MHLESGIVIPSPWTFAHVWMGCRRVSQVLANAGQQASPVSVQLGDKMEFRLSELEPCLLRTSWIKSSYASIISDACHFGWLSLVSLDDEDDLLF